MCGIIAITIPEENNNDSLPELDEEQYAAYEVCRGLMTLQHRGQDSAGIASFDHIKNKISLHKDHGLVSQVFRSHHLKALPGRTAIGHCRYQTAGTQTLSDIQPMITGFPTGMALAHNGNIANYEQLVHHLSSTFGIQTLGGNDIEIIMYYLSLYFSHKTRLTPYTPTTSDLTLASHELMNHAEGGYAIVGLFSNGSLVGLRDPNGIRPLLLGKKELDNNQSAYCLTSETLALNFLGYELVRDINPGELITIDKCGQITTNQVSTNKPHKPCMFEWIYFSAAESTFEGKSIYQTRLRLGNEIAKQVSADYKHIDIKADIVVPVPDTSRTAAIAIAEKLKIPYREALIKNRYSFRSFILNTQEKREKAVELKLSPVTSEIKGKSILLVDDSVVRGTTSKNIIKLLKKYGAKKVTLAVTCPKIKYPCFYGVDMPTREELIAHNKATADEIAKEIGADHVIYLGKENLYRALQLKDFCGACINGEYPTKVSKPGCLQSEKEEIAIPAQEVI